MGPSTDTYWILEEFTVKSHLSQPYVMRRLSEMLAKSLQTNNSERKFFSHTKFDYTDEKNP